VFSAKGFERASMAEIAALVGVVEGAIYKHFPSKRELLFEATRSVYEPVIASARSELVGIRGTRNRLRFVIWRLLQSFVEQPGLCRLIIQEIRLHDDYPGSVIQQLNREMSAFVLAILEQAKAAGELRSDLRPTLVRDAIFGGVEHLAWKVLVGRGAIDVDGQSDLLTDLILRGVGAARELKAPSARELAQLRAQVDRLERLVAELDQTPEPGPTATGRRRAPR
jgi:AcrR family transcriptional regulator